MSSARNDGRPPAAASPADGATVRPRPGPAVPAAPMPRPPPPPRSIAAAPAMLTGRPELSGVVQGARRADAPAPAPPHAGLPHLPSPGEALPGLDLDLAVDVEEESTTVAGPPKAEAQRRLAATSNQLPAICSYGRYEILGRIAFGGMAEIFLGRENLTAGATRQLVIKRILPQVADDPAFVEMFLDEARLAIQLSHPNICHIYEFGEIEETYFIAMEWVHGAPLGKIIRRAREKRGGLAPEIAAKVIAQVAEALQYAHTARDQSGQKLGIVHRDVTPHNVMVGYGGQVKLLDFGIAKASSASTKTEAGVVKGKFAYMSPQQCLGREIDARADVFALGICLYESLTGTSLYQRGTDYETMRAVIEEPAPSIRDVRPELPVVLDAIVQKALQKAAEERFQSAGQMQQALEDWLASTGRAVSNARVAELMEELFQEEVSRGPLVDSTPFGQSFKRVRTSASTDTVAGTPSAARAMQLEASSAPAPVPAPMPAQMAPTDDEPAQGSRAWVWVVAALGGLALLAGIVGIAWMAGRQSTSPDTIVTTPLADRPGTPPATGAPLVPPGTAVPPTTTAGTTGGTEGGTATGTGGATTVEPPGTGTVAPVAARGRVRVHVDVVGATVHVGEHELTDAELASGYEVEVGTHAVRVDHPERRPFAVDVEVTASADAVVEAHLEPRAVVAVRPPGRLSIDTRPWSKVYVGSRLLGTTPIAEAEVQSGVVRIRLVDRDGRVFTRAITVPANQEHSVFYNLDE